MYKIVSFWYVSVISKNVLHPTPTTESFLRPCAYVCITCRWSENGHHVTRLSHTYGYRKKILYLPIFETLYLKPFAHLHNLIIDRRQTQDLGRHVRERDILEGEQVRAGPRLPVGAHVVMPRPEGYLFVCLFGFNVALKHLRSYHDGACL